MSDTQLGEQEVEQTTQASPEPEQQPNEVAPQEDVEKQPETETGNNEEIDAPPKDNKAWAALRVENKQLKKAVEESGVDAEYLEQLRGINKPVEVQPQYKQITPDTDLDTVTQTINQAQHEAYQSRQEIARMRAQMEEREDLDAMQAYPRLKTDDVFQQIVAEKKLAARVLGRNRSTLEIAREVDKLLSRSEEQVALRAGEEAVARETAKRQASTEVQSNTSSGRSAYTNDELSLRARKGDRSAQVEKAKALIADLDF